MDTTVRIPAALRTLTGGADEVAASGTSVSEVIDDLDKRHPGLKQRLVDAKGVRRFINIYVGDENVRFTGGLATGLKAGDQITIIAAVAGG